MAEEEKAQTENKKLTHKEQRKQYTFNKLKELGQSIVSDVEKNQVPSLKIPSRGTGNIVYDDAKKYYADYSEKCSRLEQINFSSEETNLIVDLNEINKIQFELTRTKNLIDISEIGGDIDE